MASDPVEIGPLRRLPAELRIAIYHIIIDTVSMEPTRSEHSADAKVIPYRVPTSFQLQDYSGFIMSCKQIMDEFQSEWLQRFNEFVQLINAVLSLIHLPYISKLGDSVRLQIDLLHHEDHWYEEKRAYELIYQVRRIYELLPFFILNFTGCPTKCFGTAESLEMLMYETATTETGMQLGANKKGEVVAYAWKEMVEQGSAGHKLWRDFEWHDLDHDMKSGWWGYKVVRKG